MALLNSKLHPSMVVVSVLIRDALSSEPHLSITASPRLPELLPLVVPVSARPQTSLVDLVDLVEVEDSEPPPLIFPEFPAPLPLLPKLQLHSEAPPQPQLFPQLTHYKPKDLLLFPPAPQDLPLEASAVLLLVDLLDLHQRVSVIPAEDTELQLRATVSQNGE